MFKTLRHKNIRKFIKITDSKVKHKYNKMIKNFDQFIHEAKHKGRSNHFIKFTIHFNNSLKILIQVSQQYWTNKLGKHKTDSNQSDQPTQPQRKITNRFGYVPPYPTGPVLPAISCTVQIHGQTLTTPSSYDQCVNNIHIYIYIYNQQWTHLKKLKSCHLIYYYMTG